MYPTQRAAAQAVDALNRSRLFEYQRGGRRVKREAEEIVLRDNEIFEWRGSYIYGPCKLTITTNGKGEQEVEIEAADQAKRGGQVKRK